MERGQRAARSRCVVCEPAVAGSEDRQQKERLGRRIVRLFRPYRGRTTLILVSIVVTSGLGIVNPLLVQVVFDDALFVPNGPDLDLLFRARGSDGRDPDRARR